MMANAMDDKTAKQAKTKEMTKVSSATAKTGSVKPVTRKKRTQTASTAKTTNTGAVTKSRVATTPAKAPVSATTAKAKTGAVAKTAATPKNAKEQGRATQTKTQTPTNNAKTAATPKAKETPVTSIPKRTANTAKPQNGNAKTESEAPKKAQVVEKSGVSSRADSDKKRSRGGKKSLLTDQKSGKKRSGVMKTGLRTFMIVLMVAYAAAALVIGGWFFVNFFQFYLTEKSPVMGLDTESSRIKDIELFDAATIQKGKDAVLGAELYIEDIEIRQVGPSIHFLVYIPEGDDVGAGRDKGNKAVSTFANGIERPDMFGKYEAQIIVTKKTLAAVDSATLLRPATDEGAEQQFPQFGVLNHKSDGVKWGNNG